MAIEKDDFRRLVEERKEAEAQRQRPHLEHMAQVEVAADKLTADPMWDMYLRYLQGAIDETEKQRDAFAEKLHDPNIVSDEELRRAKANMLLCEERISAWRAAMDLPADLKRRGERARGVLDRMPGKDAA